MTYKKITFKIIGMNCTTCAMNIDGDLEDTGKIKEVKTNYAKSETFIEFDPQKISEKEIKRIIKQSGYQVKQIE